MLPWTPLERRWRDELFAALLPGDEQAGLPPLAALDLAPFWEELAVASPPLLRLGLRAATWALHFLPPVLLRVPRTFDGLSPAERDRFLTLAAGSDLFLLRQMTLTVKTLACMAYLRDPAVRARVDRGAP